MATGTQWFSITLNLGQDLGVVSAPVNIQDELDEENEGLEPVKTQRYDIVPGELDFQSCTPLKRSEQQLFDLFNETIAQASQDPAEILEKEKALAGIKDGPEDSPEDIARLNEIKQNIVTEVLEKNARIERLWKDYEPELSQERPSIQAAMRNKKLEHAETIQNYSIELQTVH